MDFSHDKASDNFQGQIRKLGRYMVYQGRPFQAKEIHEAQKNPACPEHD